MLLSSLKHSGCNLPTCGIADTLWCLCTYSIVNQLEICTVSILPIKNCCPSQTIHCHVHHFAVLSAKGICLNKQKNSHYTSCTLHYILFSWGGGRPEENNTFILPFPLCLPSPLTPPESFISFFKFNLMQISVVINQAPNALSLPLGGCYHRNNIRLVKAEMSLDCQISVPVVNSAPLSGPDLPVITFFLIWYVPGLPL